MPDLAKDRARIHTIVDMLSAEQAHAVRGLLEAMLGPKPELPFEDEAISEEEELAVARSLEWLKHNPGIPLEDVLAEFGLTMADWERMGQTPLPSERDQYVEANHLD